MISQSGDWLMVRARENPEAMLVLGAGLCLLLRRPPASSSHRSLRSRSDEAGSYQTWGQPTSTKDRGPDRVVSLGTKISQAARERVRDLTDGSAHLGRQASSTIQSGVHRVLHGLPLAVPMAGAAAGAAIAAIFPSTELEDRTFGGLQEALLEVATKALAGEGAGPHDATDAATDRSHINPDVSVSNSMFPGSVAASEMGLPLGGKPRSEVTGRHDPGSGANETADGLTSNEEAIRRGAEDIPVTGRQASVEDIPVFDRADTLPDSLGQASTQTRRTAMPARGYAGGRWSRHRARRSSKVSKISYALPSE